jgi:hypothetical protein
MTVPFMDAYVKLLIQTCHKRGVHAMVQLPYPFFELDTYIYTGWHGSSNPDQGRQESE